MLWGLRRMRRSSLLVGGLAHVGDDCSQFFTLSLGTDVCSQAALQELQCALILGHLQQLHGASLVGGMADNLAHQLTDELRVFGLDVLLACLADALLLALTTVLLLDDLGGFLTFV